MAERTGIPKRTLDKYMMLSDANLPGFESLLALSKGLGVSLDWLVFGNEYASDGIDDLVTMAAERVVPQIFEMFISYHKNGQLVITGEDMLHLSPEEWAGDIGFRVGEEIKKLIAGGITKQEVLEWQAQYKERAAELINDRVERLRVKGYLV